MKVLFIGDIVGRLGRKTVAEVLPSIIQSDRIDLVVANAENLAHGRGATAKTVRQMVDLGVDYFTSGEHIFKHEGFSGEMESLPVLRPANFTRRGLGRYFKSSGIEVPGKGFSVIELKDGGRVLLINLIGQTFVSVESRNPFEVADEILADFEDEKLGAIIVDFHAEATSEKMALGHYLDGRVSAVLGTHTHVPTADEKILPKKTAYVSDVGMVGSLDSVIGVKKEIIINRFKGNSKEKFEWETKGPASFNSVLVEIDGKTGKAVGIGRVDRRLSKTE